MNEFSQWNFQIEWYLSRDYYDCEIYSIKFLLKANTVYLYYEQDRVLFLYSMSH